MKKQSLLFLSNSFNHHRYMKLTLTLAFAFVSLNASAASLSFDPSLPQAAFAAAEIQAVLPAIG